jgi:hypothetical protein
MFPAATYSGSAVEIQRSFAWFRNPLVLNGPEKLVGIRGDLTINQ